MPTPSTSAASTTVADLGERALISRITTRLSQPSWVVVGPTDDAAVIEQMPRTLEVLTTDALVEGVHFDRRFCPPDAIGHRALAVNLSDLAAMGARPRAGLLSLALPAAFPVSDLDAIVDGMLNAAEAQRIVIVGGNITRTPGPLTINVTVTGTVKRRRILTRSGARAGDNVYVTGAIGDAALGLVSLRGTRAASASPAPIAEERYLRPVPRLCAGVLLGEQKAATACIDLSDGLADGVRQVAAASEVGITIIADAIPLSQELRAWHHRDDNAALEMALRGGDDYELLFTSSPRARGRLRDVQRRVPDLPITRIGVVTSGHQICISTSAGSREIPEGFVHFG